MSTQKKIFSSSEGNGWFGRNLKNNAEKQGAPDSIVDTIKSIEIRPKKVLEIGCSNGFRLNRIKVEFDSECHGIDPSTEAIEAGKIQFKNIKLEKGTADKLSYKDGSFDVIIFGFCLYLCDREDLFKIAAEADRCLSDKGYIIIKDFYPPFPYKNRYSHFDGIYSFKMDYSKMFSWNPAYSEIFNTVTSHSGFELRAVPNERVAIVVLQKNLDSAYPLEPYK